MSYRLEEEEEHEDRIAEVNETADLDEDGEPEILDTNNPDHYFMYRNRELVGFVSFEPTLTGPPEVRPVPFQVRLRFMSYQLRDGFSRGFSTTATVKDFAMLTEEVRRTILDQFFRRLALHFTGSTEYTNEVFGPLCAQYRRIVDDTYADLRGDVE
jgi:hypothetical protein